MIIIMIIFVTITVVLIILIIKIVITIIITAITNKELINLEASNLKDTTNSSIVRNSDALWLAC